MSGIKKVSRHDLYNSESEDEIIEDAPILPNIEFDIIEAKDDEAKDENMEDEEGQDFDFPLFSMGAITKPSETKEEDNKDEEERGRPTTKSNTMRITLRSPSPEIINQERPKSYYFATYTEQDLLNFQQSAITGDDVWASSKVSYNTPGKLVDLLIHNAKVEKELAQINKKVRPGKKKRLASIKGKEHKKERLKEEKVKQAKEKAKLMKKIHHKRGGKKNKKKAGAPGAPVNNKGKPQQQKPKYRTE